MKLRHLVLGCGEVGRALMAVLDCEGHDPMAGFEIAADAKCIFLHICIPYSDEFITSVRVARKRFEPVAILIHSTVPIGTSDSLDANHSPVRGKHPDLAKSILTFVKYVGGPQSWALCDELQKFGIDAQPRPSARDTEAGKLLDLMQFAASIAIEKEIHEFCLNNGLDFDLVYRQFNESYNDGFSKMDCGRFIRPVLTHIPGPIGGHCVIENMRHIDSDTARRVLDLNERYAEQPKEIHLTV